MWCMYRYKGNKNAGQRLLAAYLVDLFLRCFAREPLWKTSSPTKTLNVRVLLFLLLLFSFRNPKLLACLALPGRRHSSYTC